MDLLGGHDLAAGMQVQALPDPFLFVCFNLKGFRDEIFGSVFDVVFGGVWANGG